jgi:hypothetical protein
MSGCKLEETMNSDLTCVRGAKKTKKDLPSRKEIKGGAKRKGTTT